MEDISLSNIKKCLSKRKDIDIKKIEKAFLLAENLHKDQKRKSGEPYFVHPAWIANKLIELNADEATIISGLLHDTVEDTKITFKEIENLFGKSVSKIVQGLTKLYKFKYKGSFEERNIDNFSKMMLLAAKDFRVILVKLVDRLHNLRTIQFLPTYKQKRIAQETIDIYVPIASLLGIWDIMIELEDCSFKILDRKNYEIIDGYFFKCETDKKYIFEAAKLKIKEVLDSKNIKNKITLFKRRKYSFLQKSKTLNIFFSEINYPIGFDILVDDDETCYKVLYVIHKLFKPRFDKMQDYIARPKKNGYQAFHTWVYIEDNGEICSCIKISSKDMDTKNRLGIFGELKNQSKFSIEFINEIILNQNKNIDKKSFFEEIKNDILKEKIHIFSSEGKVYDLPKGSTALDFVFNYNPTSAPYCQSILQNDISVSNFAPLFAGDTIKLKISPKIQITSDWLNHVISNKTKEKIREILKSQEYKKNIESGKEILMRKLSWIGLSIDDIDWQKYFNNQNINNKKILESIGNGSIDEIEMISKFLVDIKKIKKITDNNKKYFKVDLEINIERDENEIFDILNDFDIKILKLVIKNPLKSNNNNAIIWNIEVATNKIVNILKCFEQLSIKNNLLPITFINAK
jgi:GTP diphosphokinase / guanosine-3',5'-bis(diphosphate) 3'-diphosphatase